MKHTRKSVETSRLTSFRRSSGFTLIELMIAVAVFLIIAGAALSLFKQHASLFGDQQNQVGLNISLRNALSQIQTDAVNAADGYFNASSTANWPIGITITNNAGPVDVLNIVTAGTVPAQLDAAGGCTNTNASTTLTLAATPGLTAGNFNTNDEILFINGAGNQMTTAKLTSPGAVVGTKIQLTHTPTNADGTNSVANDPLNLTTTLFDPADGDQLGIQYCPTNGDWVVKLNSITYTVNAANQLVRNNADVIADQIIGFKVGAATYQGAIGGSAPTYSYNAAAAPPTGYNSKFNSIRSIRVSLIGRTPPNQYTGNTFQNAFDGGFYKIESLSTVINPRNLSMND
jgi:prepilin-type N-terminal cleavage/methylation domain-containing protein